MPFLFNCIPSLRFSDAKYEMCHTLQLQNLKSDRKPSALSKYNNHCFDLKNTLFTLYVLPSQRKEGHYGQDWARYLNN